jgi:Flp pilus assembly protein TadG
MTITPRRKARTSGRRRGRGQALVEFALIIPIFLLMLIALFDLGRAVFAYNTLTNAAREGARIAAVNQDLTSIIQHAKNQTAIVELDAPNVTVDFYNTNEDGTPDISGGPCTDLVAVGCMAVVSFEATYRPMTPFISNILFGSGVTFTAKSVLDVEYRCPNDDYPTPADCPRQP